MVTGGSENPAYEPDDYRLEDDDDETGGGGSDKTNPFIPGLSSTPFTNGAEKISMQTMQHEKSGLLEVSYDETMPLLAANTEERLKALRNQNTGCWICPKSSFRTTF